MVGLHGVSRWEPRPGVLWVQGLSLRYQGQDRRPVVWEEAGRQLGRSWDGQPPGAPPDRLNPADKSRTILHSENAGNYPP